VIEAEKKALGPLTQEEKWVGIVFFLAAVAWIFRVPLEKVIPGIDDTLIAIAAALVLFLIPSASPRGNGSSTGTPQKTCPGAFSCSSAAAWRSPRALPARSWTNGSENSSPCLKESALPSPCC